MRPRIQVLQNVSYFFDCVTFWKFFLECAHLFLVLLCVRSRSGTACSHNLWGGDDYFVHGSQCSFGSKVSSKIVFWTRPLIAISYLIRNTEQRYTFYSPRRCYGPR